MYYVCDDLARAGPRADMSAGHYTSCGSEDGDTSSVTHISCSVDYIKQDTTTITHVIIALAINTDLRVRYGTIMA
jgi:hypothetical protein